MMFHSKYRPASFDAVLGQPKVVGRLKALIANRCHAFLFAGPSGVGKTTLARITARELGCIDFTTTEIDGATHTGIDAMRSIKQMLQYTPFGDNPNRAVIVDECHRLSGPAWDSLLKPIEEPPECVTWLFCTTDLDKVPPTIKSRCSLFLLKPVGEDELRALIDRVCESERIILPEGERERIVRIAKGSPRKVLVELQPYGHPVP